MRPLVVTPGLLSLWPALHPVPWPVSLPRWTLDNVLDTARLSFLASVDFVLLGPVGVGIVAFLPA